MEKTITVRAAETQEKMLNDGCDVDNNCCETLAEAKKRAKYYLSAEYMNRSESTVMMGYAQVLVNGECVADFFGKGA